jgi:PAS domain S-box-containing protein
MGYSRDEIVRMTWSEMTHPDDLAADLEQFNRVLSGQIDGYNMDKRFIRKDGKVVWAHLSVGCARKPDGRVDHHIAMVEDITSVKQAEEALRDAETRFRLLFEHSPDGILIIDPATARPLEFNETAHRQLGYSREEFSGLSIFDLEADETPEETRSRIAGVIQEGRADFETRQRTRRGEIRDVHVTAQATEILGQTVYHCIWRDITDRKRAEVALTKSEERFRKAFYTSPDAVNINRLQDGMYISINPGFTRIMGYTEEDIIGKTSIERNIWANIEDRQKLTTGLIKDGEVINLEATFRMKGGDIRYGLMSASIIDLDGVPQILSMTRDNTHRKRAEETMKESEIKNSTHQSQKKNKFNKIVQSIQFWLF